MKPRNLNLLYVSDILHVFFELHSNYDIFVCTQWFARQICKLLALSHECSTVQCSLKQKTSTINFIVHKIIMHIQMRQNKILIWYSRGKSDKRSNQIFWTYRLFLSAFVLQWIHKLKTGSLWILTFYFNRGDSSLALDCMFRDS